MDGFLKRGSPNGESLYFPSSNTRKVLRMKKCNDGLLMVFVYSRRLRWFAASLFLL